MPSYLTPGTDERPHQLMTLKRSCIQGTIGYLEYISGVTSLMRGKKDTVRAMNAMIVVQQGSLRMVISPLKPYLAGAISIPEYIAKSTKVMLCKDVMYTEYHVRNGDHGILVLRYPCMWSGGSQPVKILVCPNDGGDDGQWDVNSSMKLLLPMCGPFPGNYDGDEMSLFKVRDPKSIEGCKAFNWPHHQASMTVAIVFLLHTPTPQLE